MTTIYRENIDHTVEDDLNGRNNNWDILEDVNNKKHTHNNKSILDAITQVLINNWNTAVTHISDSVKHITSTERANWDAKETPAGAQAKVDAHANQVDNPHEVTKSQVGLDNVDNVQQATKTEFDLHVSDIATHVKPARIIIGTSASGWTAKDCHYLCDGTADDVEIIQALNDLPATGGEIVILDGTYNITASINIPKDNVSIRGSGNATTLKRMYDSTNANSGTTARGLITLNGKSGCKIRFTN